MKLNKIYNQDCLETMADMPSEFVDLVVTSPPYDNVRNYEGYEFDATAVIEALSEVVKTDGVVVWVVASTIHNGFETVSPQQQVLDFLTFGFQLYQTLIYSKDASSCALQSTNRYLRNFEYMFVFSKDKPKTLNFIKDRKNVYGGSFHTQLSPKNPDGSRSRQPQQPIEEYGRRTAIWYYDTGKSKSTKDNIAYNHPAIFPEKLARDHILSWSQPDDIVYDPFAGSGTTLKMAAEEGRKYIGSEISPKYCQIIEKRLSEIQTKIL